LIVGFGSIEDIYKKLKKSEKPFLEKGIKARITNLLKEHKEDAEFSKMLATIRTDAPIAFELPSERWREAVDMTKVLAMFEEFGFRSLRERTRAAFGQTADMFGAVEEEREVEENIDPTKLAETKVMLWLLASDFSNPNIEDILAYTKARNFADACTVLSQKLKETGRVGEVYDKIEKPLIPILRAMTEHGVLIDKAVLQDLATRYRTELTNIEQRIFETAGHPFNVSSPAQLGVVLFDELGLKPEKQKKTAGGARSTRESELEKLRGEHPIIADILDFRELRKLLSTYIDNLPPLLHADGRLHAEFVQTGTVTGRMASQNPNLQNIPLHSERGKAIRHAFVAPEGFKLLALDYSQIELRLAAVLSKDEKLCEIFKKGRDVHREVAAYVFHVEPEKVDTEMRRRAKAINFGILYGMGVNSLRAQLGTTTAEAHAFYDEYFGQFKTLSHYLESTKGFARKHGYTETLFGRRRQFPEMKSPLPYIRAQAERMAINAPIQGTQADIIKLAMVEVDTWLRDNGAREDAHLLLQVHDELVYEVKSERVDELAPKIKVIMEQVLAAEDTNDVPIIAEMKVGGDWGDMQRR
jgi:DNA polymerase-1